MPGTAGTSGTPVVEPGTDALDLLARSELAVEGRLVAASNTTLYCRLLDAEAAEGAHAAEDSATTRGPAGRGPGRYDLPPGPACVYKPIAGERPLWDFPTGTLAAREVAAFEVSQATGWALVPPTILRDGPFGPGMCQLWVNHDDQHALVDVVRRRRPATGWLHVVDAHDAVGDEVMLVHADDERLRRTALLDVVINNADRKAGHLLPTGDGLRVVDHGVTFHVEPKLRTVLWGWAGSALRPDEVAVLQRLADDLGAELGATLLDLLAAEEVAATLRRVERLLAVRRLPRPVHGWRGLPWPPF